MPSRRTLLFGLAALPALPSVGRSQERVLNIYSARHYDTDRTLYDGYTAATGIRTRLIEAPADQLIERIRAEGRNSPADVLITVDAGRLERARQAGVLQPAGSAALVERVPASLRDPAGHWFGISKRIRVLFHDRARPLPPGLARYEDLARPEFRGTVLTRSSSNIYSIGWTASMIAANGAEATEAWARGLVANLARPPSGGDTDQIRAMAAGQGAMAVANTYYWGLLARSGSAEDRAIAERTGVLWPNQSDRGAHANVSGAGVVAGAPNRDAAVRFLEYMTEPAAQRLFAEGNMEYPVVLGTPVHPLLLSLGEYREDPVNAGQLQAHAAEALRLMQRAGWR
jgi:iron(III) transport system substrate-binding protein